MVVAGCDTLHYAHVIAFTDASSTTSEDEYRYNLWPLDERIGGGGPLT